MFTNDYVPFRISVFGLNPEKKRKPPAVCNWKIDLVEITTRTYSQYVRGGNEQIKELNSNLKVVHIQHWQKTLSLVAKE